MEYDSFALIYFTQLPVAVNKTSEHNCEMPAMLFNKASFNTPLRPIKIIYKRNYLLD